MRYDADDPAQAGGLTPANRDESHDVESILKRLTDENNLLRTIIANLPDCIYVKDLQSRFLFNNPAHLHLLGAQTQQELLGQTDSSVFPVELASAYLADERTVMHTGRPLIGREEPVINLSTGERRWNSTTKVPLHDEHGRIIGLVGMSRDITERKQAQEAQRLSEARYRAIVEDQTELICRFLPDCTLTFVNEAYARYFAKTPIELIGSSFKTLIPRDEHHDVDRRLAQLTPTNPLITYEHQVIAPDANIRWQHWTDRAIFDRDGRLLEIQSVGRDVTERKEAQERVRRTAARAEALVRVAERLNAQLNLKAVLETVSQEAAHALSADGATVTLYDEHLQVFTLMADYGLPPEFRERCVPIPYAVYQRSADNRHGDFIMTDITAASDLANAALFADCGIRFLVGSSMLREGQLIGVIHVMNKSRPLSEDELTLLRGLADQAATAIANAQLYDQVQQYTNALEQRVAARTAELSRINEQLLAEIGERRRAEGAQRASETKLRLILEQMPAIVWTTDANLRLSSAMGAGLQRSTNTPSPSPHAEGAPATLAVSAAEISQLAADEHHHALRGESTRYERRHDERYLDIRIEPLRDAHNQIVGTIGLAVDVTERKQAEEDIRRALAREKELNELKSRFVSMTSHEFRTPLSTILSSAELLEYYLQDWPSDKKQEHLHRIQQAVLEMNEMLNGILVLGRADAGQLASNPRGFDAVTWCQDLIEEGRVHSRANQQISLETTGAPRAIWADEKLLRQALGNLLSNAIKYSPQGGLIRFVIHYAEHQITFAISDQGIGIPVEDRARLFDVFHRGRNVGNVAGTGLGLAIAKKAVDLHAGHIEVVSTEGGGTTFTIVLPQPAAPGV
jgi:PAS domain S-box-containing protein